MPVGPREDGDKEQHGHRLEEREGGGGGGIHGGVPGARQGLLTDDQCRKVHVFLVEPPSHPDAYRDHQYEGN